MIHIRFYLDKEGYFKADTEPEYLLLSAYFESEVQGIAEICEDLLATIQEIELGDRSQVEGIGNAYGLRLTSETATIWNEFATELTLELPLTDFKQAIEGGLIFLRSLS